MTKDIFLKEKELASWWRGIAGDPRFEKVLAFARSRIFEGAPDREELVGAELMVHTLTNLAEAEDQPFEFPSPGLHHEADQMPEREEDKPKKGKKK